MTAACLAATAQAIAWSAAEERSAKGSRSTVPFFTIFLFAYTPSPLSQRHTQIHSIYRSHSTGERARLNETK